MINQEVVMYMEEIRLVDIIAMYVTFHLTVSHFIANNNSFKDLSYMS